MPSTKERPIMSITSFLEKGWFTLPLPIVSRPSIVIGEGASGKTESLLKIAYLVAAAYDFDIILVDTKGDDDLPPRFVAIMHKAGKQRVKVFQAASYYGWVGDRSKPRLMKQGRNLVIVGFCKRQGNTGSP
jgi:hypothetical protein